MSMGEKSPAPPRIPYDACCSLPARTWNFFKWHQGFFTIVLISDVISGISQAATGLYNFLRLLTILGFP